MNIEKLKHKTRTKEENTILCSYIDDIANQYKLTGDYKYRNQLFNEYKPFRQKLIKYIYSKQLKQYYPRIVYNDVESSINIKFLETIENYDMSRSPYFTWYVKLVMRFNYFRLDIKDDVEYVQKAPSRMIANSSTKDEMFKDDNSFFDFVADNILNEDIENFIDTFDIISSMSARKRRKYNFNEMFYRHIIEGVSTSSLAKEYKVSYHAIYQNINIGKKELVGYLNNHPFSPYIFTYSPNSDIVTMVSI